MTRQHTLHVPRAGIRLAVTTASTIVLNPGSDERARRHNLARERLLIAAAVVLTVVSVELLRNSEPHERPWTLAAGFLLVALACHAARPVRRTVPTSLVKYLEPLRAGTPHRPGEIHRLVWEACELMGAEARPDTPTCPACSKAITRIHARLRVLVTTSTRPRPALAPAVTVACPAQRSNTP